MKWLSAIVRGFFEALFGWGQSQREKPGTTEDAKTPQTVRSDWNDYIAGRLRDKDRDGH